MVPKMTPALFARIFTVVSVAVLFIGLSGCASKSVTPDGKNLFGVPKTRPTNLDGKHLRLLHQNSALYVGDDQSRAFQVFAAPLGSTDVSELPDGWDKEHYRVRGWEKDKDGFGVILMDDAVVLAMFTSERKSEPDVKSILEDYEDILGQPNSPPIQKGDTTYRFWERDRQRLMICTMNIKGEGYRVTRALGAVDVMDPLRMSEAAAKEDAVQADSLTTKQATTP